MSYGQIRGASVATRLGRGTTKLNAANVVDASGLAIAAGSMVVSQVGSYKLHVQLSCSGANRETEITLALVNETTGATVGSDTQRVNSIPSSPEELTFVFTFTQAGANQSYGLYLTASGPGEAAYLLLLTNAYAMLTQMVGSSASGSGGMVGLATVPQALVGVSSDAAGLPLVVAPDRQGFFNQTTVAVTPYTVGASDGVLLVNTAAARTINLPAASGGKRILDLIDISGLAETNNITLVPNGADRICGLNINKVLMTNWGTWALISDGVANWYVI